MDPPCLPSLPPSLPLWGQAYSYRLPWPGISFREDYALSAAQIQGYRSALGGSGTQYYPLTRAEARERSKAGAKDQARTCGVTVARL